MYQPAAATAVFNDNFETNRGWTLTSGANSAASGRWQRGDPQGTNLNGRALQLGSCYGGSVTCLITGLPAGSWAGANDVDGGLTSIQSPQITLPTGTLTLSFRSYFAHSAANGADYFRVRILGANGSVQTVYQETATGSARSATWATRTISLNGFAGQTLRVRFETNDSASGSYVEAGVDEVVITRQ